ncbi:hypothetical protein [Rubeoparvulum massiliense]|uniref:hypothetical protein n=1 Tax=Rubeoparvulum massiliense TaxID=1631346 RepID=UPI0011CB5073|nr:hypothetical protein [Rubeoparvulum massiliense]
MNRLKRIGTLGLAILLVLTTSLTVWASSGTNGQSKAQKITVGNGVTVTLLQALVVPYEEEQLLAYTVEVQNNGDSSINFYNQYWFKLNNTQGRNFSMKMVKPNSYKVTPGASKQFTYYSQLPINQKTSQLQLNMIQWDFSQANYERAVGKFNLGSQLQQGIHKTKQTIALNNFEQPMTVTTNTFSFGNVGDAQSAFVSMTYVNKGDYPLTLPELKYELVTKQGKVYPLTANQGALTLNPDEKVDMKLFGTIPLNQSLQDSTLYLLLPQDKDGALPIAAVGLHRTAQQEQFKIVAAPVTVVLSETDAVQIALENIHAQANGTTATLSLMGTLASKEAKLPAIQYRWNYTGTWNTLSNDTLIEKDGRTYITLLVPQGINVNSGNTTLQFRPEGVDGQEFVSMLLKKEILSQMALNEIYHGLTITQSGSYHYPDGNTNTVVSHLSIQNTGDQPFKLPKWNFQYQITGGKSYPAEWTLQSVAETDVLAPSEQATILVTGKLPYGITNEALQLTLGESFTVGEKEHKVNLHAFNVGFTQMNQNQNLVTEAVIRNQDREITYQIKEMKKFETPINQVVVARFVTENKTNRFFDTNDALGFFQTKEGFTFKAERLPEKGGLRTPLQRDMITFWTTMPKGINTEELKFMLAEALPITEEKTVAGDIHFFAFTPEKAQDGVKNIQVYPYEINLSKFRFNRTYTAYEFNFEKELIDYVQQKEEAPTILLEVREDNKPDGKLVLSKTIVLDDKKVTNGMINFDSHNVDLESDMKWDFVYKFKNRKSTLYVYEVFNDAKHLLAEYKLY